MQKTDWLEPFQECEELVKEIEEDPSILQEEFGKWEYGGSRYVQHVLTDQIIEAISEVSSHRNNCPHTIDVDEWRKLPEMQKSLDLLHRFLFEIFKENPNKNFSQEKIDEVSKTFYGRLEDISTSLMEGLPDIPLIEALSDHLMDAGYHDAVSHSLYYSLCLSMCSYDREDREDIIQGALEDLTSDNPHVVMGTLDVLTDIQRFADAFDCQNYKPKTHYKPLGRYAEFLKSAMCLTKHENAEVADIAEEAVGHLTKSHALSLDEFTANVNSQKAKDTIRRALMVSRSVASPAFG